MCANSLFYIIFAGKIEKRQALFRRRRDYFSSIHFMGEVPIENLYVKSDYDLKALYSQRYARFLCGGDGQAQLYIRYD